ncbi:histidine kinase/DNA gyrase B/HSP90-like ATPase [Dysgonomonas alginatilytica]|uniref:histidine kinase n=1 Tax=Dysgonomonas alginatilytica TaxID=1605892 RepID=A0A2V3PRH2_9BACT|nr:ATP-binding protein [Dysgonomonas alginatilytica]PXV66786.1 histidine kinase/DNA gyrase B/HSP90-like ATPase [Dysgonomonas alginatilytica]
MFKSIEYKLILFLILLILSVAASTFLIVQHEYVYVGIFLLLAIFSLKNLYSHYKRFNQNILFLLNALDNGDYSFHFTEAKTSKREKELNQMMNRIKDILTKARKEVIENEKFLSLILESVSTGIIILDHNNNVHATNRATNKLLGLPVFTHLNQLNAVDESLPELFKDLEVKDNTQIKIANEREEIQISLHVSKITLKKGAMKVITLNNIGNELEAKEMESWIRLIRVMTHEIMNSIAPITSLTETLLFSYKMKSDETSDDSLQRNTIDALETISSTAKGLITFVDSYRKFTGVPTPQFRQFELIPLLEKILRLESANLEEKGIVSHIIYTNKQTTLNADEGQITQILVNIIKNALEAIAANQDGKIEIKVTEAENRVSIDIANNGEPIPQEIAAHIFIPFFTTKDYGTGIGLSVSRYIMRLHGGNLKHHTSNEWTVFSMVFNV